MVLIGGGILTFWGGLSGNLAAILAALFAPNQLIPTPGSSSKSAPVVPPSAPEPAPSPLSPPPTLPPSSGAPQLEEPVYPGEVVPPAQVGTGSTAVQPSGGFWSDITGALHDIGTGIKDINSIGVGNPPPEPLPPGDVPAIGP